MVLSMPHAQSQDQGFSDLGRLLFHRVATEAISPLLRPAEPLTQSDREDTLTDWLEQHGNNDIQRSTGSGVSGDERGA